MHGTTRWKAPIIQALVLVASVGHAQTILPVEPVYQRTPVWCWAAVGEMVFTYHGVANINPAGVFQCGIVALMHPVCNQDCRNCPIPAGSLTVMNNMLTRYPTFASHVSGSSTHITTSVRRSRLPLDGVQAEIDEGRPVVAGISPSGYRVAGVSEHVALIVGYEGNDLIVNDPFPFEAAHFAGNPYRAAGGTLERPGRYRIPYDAFVRRLQWRETIWRIQCRGADCATGSVEVEEPAVVYGRSCQTQATRCGPFFHEPALPVGAPCWCATMYGPMMGSVVRP